MKPEWALIIPAYVIVGFSIFYVFHEPRRTVIELHEVIERSINNVVLPRLRNDVQERISMIEIPDCHCNCYSEPEDGKQWKNPYNWMNP